MQKTPITSSQSSKMKATGLPIKPANNEIIRNGNTQC